MDATQPALVSMRVERLLPFGLLVRLDDDTLGLIREREIAWGYRERRNWRHRFKVGEMLTAVPLGVGHDDRPEFSLRLAENDPWLDVQTRFPLGSMVDGIVAGVQPYGVFVDLDIGITGLLHATRLPVWARSRAVEDLFWVGDRVRVMVERIDLKHRQIGLHYGRAFAQRWRSLDKLEGLESAAHLNPTANQIAEEPAYSPEDLPALLWNVLIVEDDAAQGKAMANWLRQAGHRAWTAAHAEEALAILEREQIDLVLTDLGLPVTTGVELIHHIRSRWPAVRCALMTGLIRVDEHAKTLDDLRASGVLMLIKPLRPADIIDLLAHRLDYDDSDKARPPIAELRTGSATDLIVAPVSIRKRLRLILDRLRVACDASKVVLFALDTAKRQVGVIEQAGSPGLSMHALVDLIYSPVRDVAEEQRVFRLEDSEHTSSRVRYLRPLLSFRSCLGVPLSSRMDDRYALFVFSLVPQAFDDLREAHATVAALTIATLLEHERFQSRAQEMQRLALLGQLSRGLVHEMNHQLSPINFGMTEIGQHLRAIEQRPSSPSGTIESHVTALRIAFQDLLIGVDHLTDTARLFGRFTVQSREQSIGVREAIEEVAGLVRDMADRAHVQIDAWYADDLPPVQVPAVQLQQMLLNIIINAVQQIELTRPHLGGRVVIRAMPHIEDHNHTIRIEIEDDGPGIHRQIWKRVFELGYTTRREGGSGLGMYITSSLAETLGGSVAIAESLMLWGTTFVVDIPMSA